MKFALCFLFALVGLTLAVDPMVEQGPVTFNSSRCVYMPESRLLSCQGINGLTECDAVGNFSGLGSFNLFGIGRLPEGHNYTVLSSVKYMLYPRALDNSTYMNHSVSVEDKLVDLVLYYGETFVEYGLRVTNLGCWERMVNSFRLSTESHLVRLGGVNGLVVDGQVSLFGEILMSDRNVQKRWLWGYGWGYPAYSWGWSGLGYYGLYGK